MTNFWEFSVWSILIGIFILMLFMLIAEGIKKIPFVKRSLLPTSVIAGILLLIVKTLWPWFDNQLDESFMSVLTYHMLALGFIASSLKGNDDKKKSEKGVIFCTGIVTVSSYIIQGIVGLIVTIPLSYFITNLIPAAGLLLPMGFGQGTGQALNWGNIYETQRGFVGGTTFGLSIAALGFIVACIVGVSYLTYLKKKGLVKGTIESKACNELVCEKDEAPSTEAIDKLTTNLMLVMMVYFVTYLVMFGLGELSKKLGDFGYNTLIPLIWGFNFLFGTVFAVLFKKIIKVLRNKKFLKYKPTNDYLLKRLSGMFFDIMIVAGVAAINISALENLWLPLILMGLFGTIVTFIYVKIMSKVLWKGYEYQGIMSMFGMLTGTASTGMILLREIDEDYQTPASDNLVYQQVPAIAFGFPVLLLLSFAPKSLLNTWISFILLILLFVGYNFVIYLVRRKKIK